MKATERKQNLKMALIAAAERAVAARGLAGLKARNLAAEAGCAVGAIYNVVADLDDLALAVNSRTLAALEEELTAAASVDPAKPAVGAERATGRLIRMANAYLDFAAANTMRWRALFEHRLPEGKPMPGWYLGEQIRLFGYIEQPMRDLQPGQPPDQLAMLARSLFSAVHGIITLGLEERLGAVSLEELRNQTTLIVSAIVTGLLAPGKAVL
ncbi:MAG: TetR/AcrR family transcriptional regulator [Pseudomonadota bacterium]|nr:TetR/AcrR family transcriptional regulator [Pseudomonadota bacterium]